MHSLSQHENEIVRYLLGEMEEPELLSIETRLMSDSNFFAEVLAFEDELIDSYLNGELSDEETKSFREHFLVTSARWEQLQFAQALRKRLRETKPNPFSGRLGKPLTAAPWIIAALVVLCAVEAVFMGRFVADFRREQQRVAGLKKELQATAADRDRERRNSLTSGIHIIPLQPVTRDNGKKINRGTETVFLELQLPNGEPGQSFKVEIQDQHGKTVTEFNNIPVAVIDSARVVFVPLQPESVPDGDFNLLLQNTAASPSSSAPLRYSFRLTRP